MKCDECGCRTERPALLCALSQPDKGDVRLDTFAVARTPARCVRCAALLLLSAANHPLHPGPVATADSANVAIWAGTGSAADSSLAPLPQMLR